MVQLCGQQRNQDGYKFSFIPFVHHTQQILKKFQIYAYMRFHITCLCRFPIDNRLLICTGCIYGTICQWNSANWWWLFPNLTYISYNLGYISDLMELCKLEVVISKSQNNSRSPILCIFISPGCQFLIGCILFALVASVGVFSPQWRYLCKLVVVISKSHIVSCANFSLLRGSSCASWERYLQISK